MQANNYNNLIALLCKTHNAEWEATPAAQDAIAWLDGRYNFFFRATMFPSKHLITASLKKQIGGRG